MKTKSANKKGRKRSSSETVLPTKSEQKSQNIIESKKSSKKMKIVNIENGSSSSVNKTQIPKEVDKQKNKSTKTKQQNKGSNEESSIKEIKTVITEAKDKNLSKLKQKKLEFAKKKQLNREVQRAIRKKTGKYNMAAITLNMERIKNKIAEIKSREELSKTAKKKLSVLQRKLRIEESNESEKSDTTEKKSNKKDDHKAGTLVMMKQKSKNKSQLEAKKESKVKKVKEESEEDDQDNSDIEQDDGSDEEESEDQSDIEEQEEEEEEETMDIVKEESDEESDENEEDEESDDEEASMLETEKEKKKQTIHAEKFSEDQKKEEGKKKRFVLFVGNLPFELTKDELKEHFLTKVEKVISVRIPTKTGTKVPRGFAYVEVSNKVDYEKGLSLHHTFLKARKINVQYTAPGSKDGRKPDIIAKNKKLDALRKAGKLAGSQGKKKLSKKTK